MTSDSIHERRHYVVRWSIAGALFGAFFPLVAWRLAVAESGSLTFSELHALHPTMWIVDLVPTVLGLAGVVIGVLYARLARSKARTETHAREIAANWTADLHTANLELVESLESRNVFYAAVTHELRSPLAAIVGYTDMAEEIATEPPELPGYLEEIYGAATAMLGMVNDLLDAAKLDAGGISIEMTRVSCNEAVEDVVGRLIPLATHKGLVLQASSTDEVFCRADPVRLRQVLTNLVANAIKFSESGVIEITPTDPGGRPTVEVSDQGPGMTSDELEAIFGAFESGESGRARRDSSGLGLAISRSLMDAMDGQISAHSAGQGEGSSFRLQLQACTGAPNESRKALLATA
ncbi:MAG: HAMP domain-containing histidine kinase [bacterium]|nr:HAMP domain-containing histidine kinase [bacterium]